MKFLFHLVTFALGAGVGIWWSASNPDAAVSVANQEQQQAARIQAAVASAKIDLLQRFLSSSGSESNSSSASSDAGYQRMLDDEKQKLADAKTKMTR